jgi:hypothetical protein
METELEHIALRDRILMANTPTQYSVEIIIDFPHVLLRMRNYNIGLRYDIGYTQNSVNQDARLRCFHPDKPGYQLESQAFGAQGMMEINNPNYFDMSKNPGSPRNEIFLTERQYKKLQVLFSEGFNANVNENGHLYGLAIGHTCLSYALSVLVLAGIIPGTLDGKEIVINRDTITFLGVMGGVGDFLETIKILTKNTLDQAVINMLKKMDATTIATIMECSSLLSDEESAEVKRVINQHCYYSKTDPDYKPLPMKTFDDYTPAVKFNNSYRRWVIDEYGIGEEYTKYHEKYNGTNRDQNLYVQRLNRELYFAMLREEELLMNEYRNNPKKFEIFENKIDFSELEKRTKIVNNSGIDFLR